MAFDWKSYCASKYPTYMTIDQLEIYVAKGKITEADFLEISGEVYIAS